ncbi:alpha/beta hydrolase [Pseudomonas silvicola]|nr:alpha/beta hydrolase [Pseudomonas silvicola]
MSSPYPLNPAIRAMLERSLTFVPASDTLAARRAAFLALCRDFTGPRPDGWIQQDVDLDGLTLRVYQPDSPTPKGGWPVLLYLHGGGWSMGGLDSHDWFAYSLARRLRVAIVAVEYRLAPEHPWPAALHDTLRAFRGLRQGQVLRSLSTECLLVCGESAGGTLAAALCLALAETGERQPLGQALLYSVLTADETLPSATEHAHAPFLTSAGLRVSIADYLPDPAYRHSPLAMPLNAADFKAQPSTFIGVAEFDPLRDHGIAYHQVLTNSGIDSELYVGKGLVHGCLRDDSIAEVAVLYDTLTAWIARLLAA